MAILDTLKKGYILLKTTSGYVKLLPKTLAKLVEMEDGTNVEDAIAKLSKKLTANRALISNASGAVAVSPVTATELKCLDGVKSNVQTQLNNITSGNTDIVLKSYMPGYSNRISFGWTGSRLKVKIDATEFFVSTSGS